MKKTYLCVLVIVIASTTQAQFDASNLSASLSGNYTMYKGYFQQKTPGVKIDLGYSINEKLRVSLGYTYHAPLKEASIIATTNGTDSKDEVSEIKYTFSTISLACNYTFIGTEEDVFSIYAPVGVSYVSVKYSEKMKGAATSGYTALDQLEPGKESGFTINLGLGAQYNIGKLRLFGDAGIALPANQQNGQYVENNIPSHFVFNAGVRIPFGERSSD